VARVASVQNINSWSKAGVMIRESLNANAANAFIAVTPGNGVTWQYRLNTTNEGGGTSWNQTTGLVAPYWVKLVRSGNILTGYYSPDGTNWTQQGIATNSMLSTLYAGLAQTSHNSSSPGTAVFDNVSVPCWQAPVIPSAPTGLTATVVTNSQINLAWNAVTNAISYNVMCSTTNGGPYTVIASVTATNYADTGLVGGTIYYYVVSALSTNGQSLHSAQVAATTPSSTCGTLIHRYSLSLTNGATVADSVGGPVWNGTLPDGGTFTNSGLILSSGSSQYANLPAGIVGSLSNLTLMAWVNLYSDATWNRIFDFGNNTTSYMFLTPQNGASGTLRFAITTNSSGGEQQINCTSTLSTGVWHQVTVTLNTNLGILYLDGVAVGTNTGMTLNPAILGITTNNYLGKSQWADPYFNGLFDEFRIYSVGLSSAEIAATAALGSGGLLSAGSPPISLARTGMNLTFSWPLANAGFTLQLRTNLASGTWLNTTSPVPQIAGGQWQVAIPLSQTNNSIYYRLLK
jgi:hypothetical protein